MSNNQPEWARIADALERLTPERHPPVDWLSAPAYVWEGKSARAISVLEAPALEQLRGIDRQKAIVCENVTRLAHGAAAHDMLLWGSRGMGKSALVRSAAIAAQQSDGGKLALVQIGTDALAGLARLFAEIGAQDMNFLVFIDDLGFAPEDAAGPRHLRSWLEGGVEARPANARLAVTSNRRAIRPREASEQDGALNPRDAIDDALALSDRFGLSIGFHACSQADYLTIIAAYADPLGLKFEQKEALEWAKQRGARSGRTAWQFVTELAGRAGIRL